ncbi:MAG TPA: substrate-binding domain-containing protein [Trebonia sp.]|nr:substrate-binding domain-containing protein [Trebonia sp.]
MRLLAGLLAALTAVFASLLAQAQPSSAAVFAPITGAGSTWAYPAIHTWIDDENQNGLAVNYAPNGSSSGRALFADGQADWAASEIPYGVVDGANTDSPPARGFAYMPSVAGATTFAYNLTVNGQRVTNLRLSGATVAGIFTDKITMWNDPAIAADNPGLTLPALAITPVVRSDGSGATADFTQWMLATDPSAWQAYCTVVGRDPCTATSTYPIQPGTAMIGQTGDPGVPTYVAQSSSNGAIGYMEYSWALEVGLPVANLLNAAGYYTSPTPANVGVSLLAAQLNSDGTANLAPVYADTDPRTYELSSYSYLIIPTDLSNGMTGDKGYTLGAFGQYALCQGQGQVAPLGYAPLPINLVEDGFAQLAKIPGALVPTTTAAILAGCANPTFASDGTDTLANTDPDPPACDQQGAANCAASAQNGTGTVTSLSAAPSPAYAGQGVTLQAVVTGPGTAVPAGTVQFSVGGTIIGSPVTLSTSGVASTVTMFAVPGTESLAAVFFPTDPTAFGSSTAALSLIVNPSPYIGLIPLAVTDPPTGAFSLTVDTADLVTLAVSGPDATASTTDITVSDTRNTYPGWSVGGQATDFTGSGTAAGATIAGNQLGWTPHAFTSPLTPGVTLGNPVSPADPGLGTTPALLAAAPAGAGNGYVGGTTVLYAGLDLRIPPPQAVGPYTGGLEITAVTSGP